LQRQAHRQKQEALLNGGRLSPGNPIARLAMRMTGMSRHPSGDNLSCEEVFQSALLVRDSRSDG
jgi:hypothetical protein